MIIYELPGERLLCCTQTAHALMAAEFCRHWGNADFAVPEPFDLLMTAVAQHDNGWWEWEQAPLLRDDGYPMDFLAGPAGEEKLEIWRRGVARAAAQHPYAGALIWRHANLLYEIVIDMGMVTDEAELAAIADFAAAYEPWLAHWRQRTASAAAMRRLFTAESICSHTALLQFGDFASLQVAMRWARERTLPGPVDNQGTLVDVRMHYDESTIYFDPWPYGVDAFTVSLQGRLLERRTFADHSDYQQALASAPYQQLSWQVVPA